MNMTTTPLAETTRRAIAVLSKELGIVETIRFLSQFGAGLGDYTKEREALIGDLTLDDAIAEIRRSKRGKPKKRAQSARKRGTQV
jgi:hypothetical protein